MKRILVIGESCKDIFVYCKASRLAPDLPVPVLEIEYSVENPGMAMNVHLNIKKLFSDCDLHTNTDWKKITKTRYVHNETNHSFLRVDTAHDIESIVYEEIPTGYDLVVIADYNKGFLSEEVIQKICQTNEQVFLDTKKRLGTWAEDATFIKINNYEYNRSLPFIGNSLAEKIIRTNGGYGSVFRGKEFPVTKVEVKDSSGAGDTFMAALAVNYLRSKDIEQSIIFANRCAEKIVTKRGVNIIW